MDADERDRVPTQGGAMRGSSLCALGAMAPTPVLSAMRLFPESFRPGAAATLSGRN